LRERIDADERGYFATEEGPTTDTKAHWLVVRLNSITKTTNRGFLFMLDGTRVSYAYKGEYPQELYNLIPHDGPVRVWCVAHMDTSLKPISVDIYRLEKVQGELFPHEESSELEEPE
jgi:hypothetical protein